MKTVPPVAPNRAAQFVAARLREESLDHDHRIDHESNDDSCYLTEADILPDSADEPVDTEPVEDELDTFEPGGKVETLSLVETILKNPRGLQKLIRMPEQQPELIPRFLAISLIGFTFFGVAFSVVLNASAVWPQLSSIPDWLDGTSPSLIEFVPIAADEGIASRWLDGSTLKLIVAYSLGLIAATGVCLPSLYFYGLLAGVKMSMLDVTVHALKSKATAAIALIGILPIYAAVALGMMVFDAPQSMLTSTLWLGLTLPFIAGLWGTQSLYLGFAGLVDTIAAERRCRRACLLRRLVLSWSACYTAVMPVMIYTLWDNFGA